MGRNDRVSNWFNKGFATIIVLGMMLWEILALLLIVTCTGLIIVFREHAETYLMIGLLSEILINQIKAKIYVRKT